MILIDNGSLSTPLNLVTEHFPETIYIRSEKNLGFAGGNNLGIAKASGDYLFFVNNDTEFTESLVDSLVTVLDSNPAIGIVSPKIMFFAKKDIIQYAGFTSMNFNTGRNRCIGQFECDKGQYDSSPHPTAYAHGAAMMVKREAIEKAGPMPENFFLYYEEMDWCESIRKCGYQIWIDPMALIYHKESISVGQNSLLKEYYMTRNRILFIRRNASAWQRTAFYIYFSLIVAPKNILKHLISGRPDMLKAFFKGIWWNLRFRKEARK